MALWCQVASLRDEATSDEVREESPALSFLLQLGFGSSRFSGKNSGRSDHEKTVYRGTHSCRSARPHACRYAARRCGNPLIASYTCPAKAGAALAFCHVHPLVHALANDQLRRVKIMGHRHE